MLRVLHASFQRYWSPGVVRQVEAEQAAADALSIPWASRLFTARPETATGAVVVGPAAASVQSQGARRRDFYAWLEAELDRGDHDLLLLRHTPAAMDQVRFLTRMRTPVLLAHHTLEGPELASAGGVKARAKGLIETVSAFASLRLSAGVVAVTPEILAYERRRGLARHAPGHVYPNGIFTADTQIQDDRRHGDTPVLLFVASHFAPWHGLDRFLAAACASDRPFHVHIVGSVNARQAAVARSDSRFSLHGVLDACAIQRRIEESWLGLSSFALDRLGMTQACTLKVREYLSAGLPVYAGHADVFDQAYPFFIQGPCEMDLILAAATRARNWSRREVAHAARPHIDKRQLLRRLYEALQA